MKNCPYCGSCVPDNSVYCRNCGNKLVDAHPNDFGKAAKKSSHKKRVRISIICVIVLLACTIAYFVIAHTSAENTGQPQIEAVFFSDNNKKSVPTTGNTAELVLKCVTYKVISEDKKSCTVEITSPDLYDLLNESIDRLDNQDTSADFDAVVAKYISGIDARLQNKDFSTRTTTIVVPKEDGILQFNTEFLDAIYGGVLTFQKELISQYMEEPQ